jgi:WD40 repeat protein/mono/diheme cytochrome c family protein
MFVRPSLFSGAAALLNILVTAPLVFAAEAPATGEKVSYHQHVKPIFQAQCQGCHQPAKQSGGFEMTNFARLLAGGESGVKAVVPGNPDESYLVDEITPDKNGKAEMPRGAPALSATDIDLIRRWIAEGAQDDTPANVVEKYDSAHPPVYTRAPVVPSLDFSPDGKLLATAGFHEVLLHERTGADWSTGTKPAGRLIGLSERVEAVKFSPDGKKLAVAGGLPARLGEVQVWDVATKKLLLSRPVGYDTVYGASWSPDGKSIAIGCGDNSVRVLDAATGEQTLFMGSHNDWALDTVFSVDGSHLISVSRDRSAKLVEVETQRFIDNITSITPGALKGGLQAVVRHPERDEIVFGGSDGTPKIYRVHRITKRVIGDDANLIAVLPALSGRIFGVDVSRDGKRIAAVSSNDGLGEIGIYTYKDDTSLPDDIKAIVEKRVSERKEEDDKKLDQYTKSQVKQLAKTQVKEGGLFAVAFTPDGKQLAVAGADGLVRIVNAVDGKIAGTFTPVPLAQAVAKTAAAQKLGMPQGVLPTESLPEGTAVESIAVLPTVIDLKNKFDYAQLIISAKTAAGATLDVSRQAKITSGSAAVEVLPGGLVRALADGQTALTITLAGKTVSVPVKVAGTTEVFHPDYIRDVNPVLTRLGCNQGTCHGAKDGKNGFKLSLRGYDALYDLRAFADDHASRRLNVAVPEKSLMLLKATGAVPHAGGQLTKPGDAYYEIIRGWIAGGAKLDLKTPRVIGIEVQPVNPIVDRAGQRQQMRVLARYAGGRLRDVTREAFLESGNTETVQAGANGLMLALRRGEAPVLARFEGAYAATTLTIMGNREGFEWKQPPAFNKIDELTAAKWKRMKIIPSEVCTDEEFIRRVTLDLTGLPPTGDAVKAFLADKRDQRQKRDELIDKLVGSDPYIDHWTNKWADLLQVNPKFLGSEGAKLFRDWIRGEVAKNTPYDQFVREVLTSAGSNKDNPAAAYYKILRDPATTMENTTHLFLAVRFNCNKCHDHPFERWTQDQYYETAAYFAQVGLKADPNAKGAVLGGTAVEGAKPLYEVVFDQAAGDIKHDRTGQVTPPKFPYAAEYKVGEKASRREQLAAWITSADNDYFARSYVNRLWGYLFGVGIMEPIDDIRAGNPPSNPELLDYLTEEFVKSGFDVRHVVKLAVKSRTYQLAVSTNKWNADDKINYSHATARRLPAEVLYDAIHVATGSPSRFPGYPDGTRAAQLHDVSTSMGGGFLQTFGRPARESGCECERAGGMALGPVMAMISGPTLSDAVGNPKNDLAKLVAAEKDDAKLVDELFLRVLNRHASAKEVALAKQTIAEIGADHVAMEKKLAEKEAWWKPIFAKLETERTAAIAKAKTDLTAYEKASAPAVAAAEKARTAAIDTAAANLATAERRRAYEQAAWEAKLAVKPDTVKWQPLKITEAKYRNASSLKFSVENDTTVLVLGGEQLYDTYQLVGETTLPNVTALMVEVLPDERIPGFGPGYGNRNFVLTELILTESGPLGDKTPRRKGTGAMKFSKAIASTSQDKFDVAGAIDGKNDVSQNNGWATAGKAGPHRAVFQLEKALANAKGSSISLQMSQIFKPNFLIGKFRLWVTDAKDPLSLGVPADVAAAVAKPADKRTAADWDVLAAHQRLYDESYYKAESALWAARLPLPVDPKLVALKDALKTAEMPVPIDPQLVQMRADFEMSKVQQADKRLTTVQDLAWALMNSPAFLFNH